MAENDDDPNLDLDPPEDPADIEEPDQDQQDDQDQGDEDQQVTRTQDQQGDQQDRRTGEDRQPSRRDRRIETLTASLAEERQARAELNRRLDTILAGQNRPSPGETPEQRAQRLALLTPEERIQETLREDRERHALEMRNLHFTLSDGNDKSAFEAKALVDSRIAKWKDRVEVKLTELRQQGQNITRENLFYWMLGKSAFERSATESGKQKAAAQGRLERQRTRPSNSGSDVQANRRDRSSSLERRLENQLL